MADIANHFATRTIGEVWLRTHGRYMQPMNVCKKPVRSL